MNVTPLHAPLAPRTPVAVQAQAGSAPHSARYRERDFGIGYGRSSGYVRNRSYVASQPTLFRCR